MTSPPNHMGDNSSLRYASHPARPSSAWMLIDETPKDGRTVWVANDFSMCVAYWAGDKEKCWRNWFKGCRYEYHDLGIDSYLPERIWFTPTHWMPVPPELGAKGNPGATNNPADLIERARDAAQSGREIIGEWDHNPNLFDELADRITALEEALREVRSQIHNLPRSLTADAIDRLIDRALGAEGEDL